MSIKGTLARNGSINPKKEIAAPDCSWKRTFSVEFRVNYPKFYRNCMIPQDSLTRKLGQISAFYAARPVESLINIYWKYGDPLGYSFKWEENPSNYSSKQFPNDWKNNLKLYKTLFKSAKLANLTLEIKLPVILTSANL